MKIKMTLLILLAAVVTVSGVYATWTFAEGGAQDASTTVNVAMTGVTSNTEKGTLSVQVMGANGFTLAVDDTNNDHLPEIKKTGEVTVTFTPASTASKDIKDFGIDVQVVIGYAPYAGGPGSLGEWKYAGTQIFEIGAAITLSSTTANRSSEGVFTWTIPAAQINIDLTEDMQDVLIDTLDKYNDMNAELAKGHFVLTVSEN